MANAKDARQWARNALHGIGDSLYTPFSGRDGDDIDWDAYRTLVRHCVGTLGHPMLWVTRSSTPTAISCCTTWERAMASCRRGPKIPRTSCARSLFGACGCVPDSCMT